MIEGVVGGGRGRGGGYKRKVEWMGWGRWGWEDKTKMVVMGGGGNENIRIDLYPIIRPPSQSQHIQIYTITHTHTLKANGLCSMGQAHDR